MSRTSELLGANAKSLLEHRCQTIPREALHVPGPDFVDRIFIPSDRNPRVLANLQRLLWLWACDCREQQDPNYLPFLQ